MSKTTERDPRIDPMPGDVLRQPGTIRQYVRDRQGDWLIVGNGLWGEELIPLSKWQEWAVKYAEVVTP